MMHKFVYMVKILFTSEQSVSDKQHVKWDSLPEHSSEVANT